MTFSRLKKSDHSEHAPTPSMIVRYFGKKAPLVENLIYKTLDDFSDDYNGGCWKFHQIKNGFFMAPDTDKRFRIEIPSNYTDEVVSAQAAGIIACLFAYNAMAWTYQDQNFCDLYHSLVAFSRCHPESSALFTAID